MWPDNETEVDLLGVDLLVDGLIVALTEPRLLPLTVGVLGDWGSGKSSLLRITKSELEQPSEQSGRYICIWFSPWHYEGYEDVKIALMAAVLERLETELPEDSEVEQQRVQRLIRFLGRLRRPLRTLTRGALAAAPVASTLVVHAIDPSLAQAALPAVQAAAGAIAGEAAAHLGEPASGEAVDEGPQDIIDFRSQFADLVSSMTDVAAVIVFIDDLDRCLPETVVDTFEAIRLFLNTPKSAYVVAANQRVVESAIDSRYPDLRREDGSGIGADYLEKMLQLKISIPTLSAPEAQTYVNLLLAELHLPPDQFTIVRTVVSQARRENLLAVPLTGGTVGKMLADPPDEFLASLAWSANIASSLGRGLRGNPRQLKRFLNSLLLKTRTAKRRSVTLLPAVLAKLMVLEDQHVGDFQRLFDWQLGNDGPISELAAAEAAAWADPSHETVESGRDPLSPSDSEVLLWADKPHIRRWLRLDPRLGSMDLRPYFTYSRDKLSVGINASRLAPHLQALLVQARSDVVGARRDAVARIAALDAEERAILLDALGEVLTQAPDSVVFDTAIELVEAAPATVAAVCAMLLDLPSSSITASRVTAAVRRLPVGDVTVTALLDGWATRIGPAAATALSTARTAQARRHQS